MVTKVREAVGTRISRRQDAPPRRRLFNVEEYYRLSKARVLPPDERTELLDGEIMLMAPIGSPHAMYISSLNRFYTLAVSDAVIVRIQTPIRLSSYSEVQPDLALVRFREDRYRDSHPAPPDALLIVEVSDTSLSYDRGRKLRAYARAGIVEYWVLSTGKERLYVYRDPEGEGYKTMLEFGRGDSVAPLALPDLNLKLATILS